MGAAVHYKKPELDLIETLAANGLSAGDVANALAQAGHRRRPDRAISLLPAFTAGRRAYTLRVEAEQAEARRAAAERRRASAARFWQHPEFPGVSLPRLSILDGVRA